MYYILNGSNQIIAADTDVLTLCGVNHIDELYVDIATKKISFTYTSEQNLDINYLDTVEQFTLSKTILSSLIGQLTIVNLSPVATPLETTLALEDELSTVLQESPIVETPVLELDDTLLFDTPIAVTPTEEAPALDLGEALDDSLCLIRL
ncbi:MAG: hypothetical protein Q9M36_07095 [Sulfurovum sp.]|nr:hypothetical protein [Sulfurovum sp.]